jgi:uncharacterized integral membrane protein
MRRSFAPRRPIAFMEQWPLVLVCLLTLSGGILLIVWALTR